MRCRPGFFLRASALLLCLTVLGSWVPVHARSISEQRYVIQTGTLAAIPNFIQPEAGCNWSGLGGQAFDRQGYPTTGLVVKISGKLEGLDVLYITMTGSSTKLGPAGFEVTIADQPVASQGSMFIQLLDIAGTPVSDLFPITTYASCEQNLVIVNFVASATGNNIYLPLIIK